MELLFKCKKKKTSGWEFAGSLQYSRPARLSLSIIRDKNSPNLQMCCYYPSDTQALEKLLLNHMQFKWNWNNNPGVKRSVALSYQALQCVGCFTVLAHGAQGLHLTISAWNTTPVTKKKRQNKIDAAQSCLWGSEMWAITCLRVRPWGAGWTTHEA